MLDDINRSPFDTGGIKLQQDTLMKIQLPVAKAGFRGDSPPLVGSLAKGIAYRSVDLIAVCGDSRADRCAEVFHPAIENLLHRFYSSPEQAGGSATPAEMDGCCGMPFPLVKYDRVTIGNQDSDQDVALVGDYCIAVDTLEMRNFGIGLIDHQDFTAMDLIDRQEKMWLKIEGPGDRGPIGFHLGRLVPRIETEIE